MSKTFAKIILCMIILSSGWVLVSRQYALFGSQRREAYRMAKNSAAKKLKPAVEMMAADLMASEKTGELAPRLYPGRLLLQQRMWGDANQVEYGLTPDLQLYRKSGKEIKILASGVLQFWLAPGKLPLSWTLNITVNLEVAGKTEPVIFGFYFPPPAN